MHAEPRRFVFRATSSGHQRCRRKQPSTSELYRRVADLEIESASGKEAAFVFIKAHAVTEQVKDVVSKRFGAEGISVISGGTITADQIDKDMLIDTHCGTIAAEAMKQKPGDLTVQQKVQKERIVNDEVRVEFWCGTLQYATPRGVASPRCAGVPEVCADRVVCMMRAFGSGGRLGPIIALFHRCLAIAGS